MTELTAKGSDMNKEYVFGLDIGTRNVVGSVGYNEGNTFRVMSTYSTEHETRSMIDGQIHDINRVAHTIKLVKEKLEENLDFNLSNVCIAAAGRVLQTVTTHVEYEYPEETIVTDEDLNTLDLLGVDQAQHELAQRSEEYKFYCVGYTVMKYYLNDEPFTNLEGHKASKIAETIIVTFLPEDVVDGLYSAVERANLQVSNLTLEPIAAINVAIPESYRMLNISLVDVGAGTSDICITKDGSIVAYGMIPFAGDELTEILVQEYLVDFKTAEQMKKDAVDKNQVVYTDIMGIEHTVDAEDVWKVTEPTLDKITTAISDKIIELNGGESVAAVFVVGGGGKVHDFCKKLSDKLGIIEERVALRGEEVMGMVTFDQEDIKKDPLLVTPIGICLNYFEQRNRFIMVRFNGEMMKLYDNGHLKIVDAALQAGLSTEEIFPQRGKEIHYTVNGTKRMARGIPGESARVVMNGIEVGLNDKLEPNSDIIIETSTKGDGAKVTIESLKEYNNEYVQFIVNGQRISCPKFVEVNGQLESGSYVIQDGDEIETRAFYTVGQLAAFMDVEVSLDHEIVVNNRPSSMGTLIYENFTVDWTVTGYGLNDGEYRPEGISALNEDTQDYEEEIEEEVETLLELTENDGELIPRSDVISEDLDVGSYVDNDENDDDFVYYAKSQQHESPVEKDEDEDSEEDKNEDSEENKNEDSEEDKDEDSQRKMPAPKNTGVSFDMGRAKVTAESFITPTRPVTPFSMDLNKSITQKIRITVNGEKIEMVGKREYIFVDIYNYYDFDPEDGQGRKLITLINDNACSFADVLQDGDEVTLRWEERNR